MEQILNKFQFDSKPKLRHIYSFTWNFISKKILVNTELLHQQTLVDSHLVFLICSLSPKIVRKFGYVCSVYTFYCALWYLVILPMLEMKELFKQFKQALMLMTFRLIPVNSKIPQTQVSTWLTCLQFSRTSK